MVNSSYMQIYQQDAADSSLLEDEYSSSNLVFEHHFTESVVFPHLSERHSLTADEVNILIPKDPDLDIGYSTTAHIRIVESGAGYNNTLGAYTVQADGTITAVEIAYNNVKVPLQYQKKIDRIDKKIEKIERQIDKHPDKADKYEDRLEVYQAQKDKILSKLDPTFEYEIKGDADVELGFFIISNGDRINKGYGGLNGGELRFVYGLGGDNERLAKVTDNAANVSLIYVVGDNITVLQGDVYHATDSNDSKALNPDGQIHAIAGLADADNDSVLRIGFEDLKNLGDADFNDVVFDVSIETVTFDGRIIHAGNANDVVYGSDGADTIFGGQGADIIYGGAGDDTLLRGDMGRDTIYGEDGDDLIHGNDGDDTLYGGNGNDIIYGQDGADTLYGDAGDDYLYGHADNDSISGGDGNDFIDGGDGDDALIGGEGVDSIFGGEGADLLSGGEGDDILNGGAGIDTVTYSTASAGVNVQLASSTAMDGDGGVDTLIAIENIRGSNFDDLIGGGLGDNILQGLFGNDTMQGGAGNDELYGGAGSDILYGGAGDDLLLGGADADTLFGGAGVDTFGFTNLSNGLDLITDFTRGGVEGDVLNISDIISGLNLGGGDIDDSVVLGVVNSNKANLWINDGAAWTQVAVIQGADFSGAKASDLIFEGTLVIDQNLI